MQSDDEHSPRSFSNYVVQSNVQESENTSNVLLAHWPDAINPSFLKQTVVWAVWVGRSCLSNPALFKVILFLWVSAGVLNMHGLEAGLL